MKINKDKLTEEVMTEYVTELEQYLNLISEKMWNTKDDEKKKNFLAGWANAYDDALEFLVKLGVIER